MFVEMEANRTYVGSEGFIRRGERVHVREERAKQLEKKGQARRVQSAGGGQEHPSKKEDKQGPVEPTETKAPAKPKSRSRGGGRKRASKQEVSSDDQA